MRTMSEIKTIVTEAISEVTDANPSGWEGGDFAAAKLVEIDNRGDIGERIVVKMLRALGRKVSYHPGATSEDKGWDLICDDFSYEIKTATLGKDKITFQHENIYKTRLYDGLIFVDIAPSDIYVSCHDKRKIDWRAIHRRKDSAFYKWDTHLRETRKFPVLQNRIETLSDFQRIFEKTEAEIRVSKQRLNLREL